MFGKLFGRNAKTEANTAKPYTFSNGTTVILDPGNVKFIRVVECDGAKEKAYFEVRTSEYDQNVGPIYFPTKEEAKAEATKFAMAIGIYAPL